MKYVIAAFIFIHSVAVVYSHDPTQADFFLYNTDRSSQLRIEVPWTYRIALIKRYPYLVETDVDNEGYLDCSLEYFNDTILLESDLTCINWTAIHQYPGDHGHAYVFILSRDSIVDMQYLTGRIICMSEVYSKQKNHLYLSHDDYSDPILLIRENRFAITNGTKA